MAKRRAKPYSQWTKRWQKGHVKWNQSWRERNKEKNRRSVQKSSAKRFIRNATPKDLDWAETIIDKYEAIAKAKAKKANQNK